MVNLAPGHDPLDIYVRCAALSGRSFAHWGYDWTLVTDRGDVVAARCDALGITGLRLREETFTLDVPQHLPFRSAHFKLELMEKFGSGTFGDMPGLVDLDAVCLAPLPAAVLSAPGLAGYDMTAVATFGQNERKVRESLSTLRGKPSSAQWWGGEFVMGSRAAFAKLADAFKPIWDRYVSASDSLVHLGDEMVLTAGLQDYCEAGGAIMDGGAAGAIARYWSARTGQQFPPFRQIEGSAILHLPADKPFLASACDPPFDPEGFRDSYRRYLRRRIAVRQLATFADRVLGKKAQFTPRY